MAFMVLGKDYVFKIWLTNRNYRPFIKIEGMIMREAIKILSDAVRAALASDGMNIRILVKAIKDPVNFSKIVYLLKDMASPHS